MALILEILDTSCRYADAQLVALARELELRLSGDLLERQTAQRGLRRHADPQRPGDAPPAVHDGSAGQDVLVRPPGRREDDDLEAGEAQLALIGLVVAVIRRLQHLLALQARQPAERRV